MKNTFSLIALALIFGLVLTNCQKKDSFAPKIFLEGNNPYIHTLNATYVEPGYTAEDNKDGDVTSRVMTATDLNEDKTGTYEIEYSVSDDAGLTGTAIREVIVKNSIEKYCVSYSVTKYFGGALSDTYNTTLKPSATQNMIIKFPNLSNLGLNVEAEIGETDIDTLDNTKTYYVTIIWEEDIEKEGLFYRIGGRKDTEGNPLSTLVVEGSDYTINLKYRQQSAPTAAGVETAPSTNVDETLVKVNL